MRLMHSDRRRRRSGQTRGLYFVVQSGDGAPRDNQATFFSTVQADARHPSFWRRGLPDGRRELPTAAPLLSSGSPPRRPHTPDTSPPRARRCATDSNQHRRRAIGRRADEASSPTHPPARACGGSLRRHGGVRPPLCHLHGPRRPTPLPTAAAPPVARDKSWFEAALPPPAPKRWQR